MVVKGFEQISHCLAAEFRLVYAHLLADAGFIPQKFHEIP